MANDRAIRRRSYTRCLNGCSEHRCGQHHHELGRNTNKKMMSMGHSNHDEEFRLNTPDAALLNRKLDRRNFLLKTSLGLGALATGSLLGMDALRAKSAGGGLEEAST